METIREELPKYWYVLYRTEAEFQTISDFYNKDWDHYEGLNYGYCNFSYDMNWFNLDDKGWIEKIKENNIIQISYEEFEVLVLDHPRPEPFPVEPIFEDMSYLIDFIKKLELR